MRPCQRHNSDTAITAYLTRRRLEEPPRSAIHSAIERRYGLQATPPRGDTAAACAAACAAASAAASATASPAATAEAQAHWKL